MRRSHSMKSYLVVAAMMAASTAAFGSEAETSASATGNRSRSGDASATARYEGDVGFARTDTRTGAVNLARGIAVGYDSDGLSLSLSTAIAPKRGPAIAATYNVSIGANGRAASSSGHSVADGGTSRTAYAGGSTSTRGGATAIAGGSTRNGGVVQASTHSAQAAPPKVVRRVQRVVGQREVLQRVVRGITVRRGVLRR
jgi:hypothetical protein